jgi:predicted dehydrogenase
MVINSNTIRWGIIGCGDVAEHKSGPALYRTPGSELVAVMRRDAGKAQDFCVRHGAKRWYTRVDELLADPRSTPSTSRRRIITQARNPRCRSRQSHAVRKTDGISVIESQAIVDACALHRVPLTVAYYRRFWQITRGLTSY